jgi:cell wall-associated NlpC family hydrolase
MIKKLLIMLIVCITILLINGCTSKTNINDNIQQNILSDLICENALLSSQLKINAPYVLGGRGPNTFDCSGLIVWAYKNAYPNLKLKIDNTIVINDCNINELWNYNIELIQFEQIKPGYIIFISDLNNNIIHGGLFIKWIDNSTLEFINASSYFGKVVIDTWNINEFKREQKIIGVGRLKTVI